MKVDREQLKNQNITEVPRTLRKPIKILKKSFESKSKSNVLGNLRRSCKWPSLAKYSLYHMIDILDCLDTILSEAAAQNNTDSGLNCDEYSSDSDDINLLLQVLKFTTILIEKTKSEHGTYNSFEYLTKLLSSRKIHIVLGVLKLLHALSKRSYFKPPLGNPTEDLLHRLRSLVKVI